MHNQTLLSKIKELVANERRIGIEILECLREIEKRKAYSELKYDGIFTYCVKELGFTESQAYQRIQAMRALRALPELKPMIESGALSVSAVAKVQVHLRHVAETHASHKVLADSPGAETAPTSSSILKSQIIPTSTTSSRESKLELFTSLQNCSSREIDRKLADARGEVVREKLVLELEPEIHALWTKVKNRSAHKTHGQNTAILKMLLESWVNAHKVKTVKARIPTEEGKAENNRSAGAELRKMVVVPKKLPLPPKPQRAVPLTTWQNTRFIPIALKREILKRDQQKCQRCGSEFALQFDHFPISYAHGGKSTSENMRLLCRSCNQFMAIKDFGLLRAGRR